MALTVETGTGAASSESYASVADADTYHSNRGVAAWALLTTAQKEQALRRATDYMMQTYRQRWKGVRVNAAQALDWPRYGVYLEPVLNGAVSAFPYLLASDVVPAEVIRANIELALRASTDDLLADLDQKITREVIGPITTEYDQGSSQNKRYPAIDRLLAPLIGGGSSLMLVRA